MAGIVGHSSDAVMKVETHLASLDLSSLAIPDSLNGDPRILTPLVAPANGTQIALSANEPFHLPLSLCCSWCMIR